MFGNWDQRWVHPWKVPLSVVIDPVFRLPTDPCFLASITVQIAFFALAVLLNCLLPAVPIRKILLQLKSFQSYFVPSVSRQFYNLA